MRSWAMSKYGGKTFRWQIKKVDGGKPVVWTAPAMEPGGIVDLIEYETYKETVGVVRSLWDLLGDEEIIDRFGNETYERMSQVLGHE